MLTDVTLNNDCQEECIIQEIDKGISFLTNAPSNQPQLAKQTHQPMQQPKITQPPQQKQQRILVTNTPVIKSENRQAQPCGMKSTTHIKNEQSMNAPTQCMIIPTNIQQTDQKPLLIQNVQTVKLPLPRNTKQNPIFIQPVNGSIPLIPVTTTQPQIQTVNLVSSTHSPVLKPGKSMDCNSLDKLGFICGSILSIANNFQQL